MASFKCTCCKHAVSVLKYYPDSGEAVCRLCREIGRHSPMNVLRALGFLFRAKPTDTAAERIKTKTMALVAHDRALRGVA